LLFEESIHPQSIIVSKHEDLIGFFQNTAVNATYPFDLLASSFYLLSLYENYLPGPRDAHGRFSAQQSLAFQHGFLHRPLVDEYCLHLTQQLTQLHPAFSAKFPVYQYTPTYDIDVSWAYLHRPYYRQAGSILKDILKGNFANVKQRRAVLKGREEDPFFTFPYLDQLHQRHQLKAIYFFLLGNYHGLDRSISSSHPAQQKLIKQIAPPNEVGIHPSILSNHNYTQFELELYRFETILGQAPQRSRQHYLMLQLPDTYLRLSQAGIQHDYSLGYAQTPGFRASIARPYLWYNLQDETTSNLLLHPFVCMDVALKRSSENQAASIIDQASNLIEATKAVNGHLYTLWHNSSFSVIDGWDGWKAHYEYIVKQALMKRQK
jgi:hypothetical protein